MAIEDFKVMRLVFVVNAESCLVHGPVDWAEVTCLVRWSTYCGWVLGFKSFESFAGEPVDAVVPGLGKGTICRSFYAVLFIQNFLLTGVTAELRGAIGSASIQQFYQRDSQCSVYGRWYSWQNCRCDCAD